MASDGKVVISTALDNSNIEKDIQEVSGEFGGLKKVLGDLSSPISKSMSKPVGEACAKIQKDIDAAQNKIEQYQKQVQRAESAKLPLVEQADQLGTELDIAKGKLAELQAQQQSAEGILSTASERELSGADLSAYLDAYAQKPQLDAAVARQQEQVDSLQKRWDTANDKIDSYNRKIDQATKEMSGQKAAVAELNKKLDTAKKETKQINKNVSGTKSGFGSVSKSVKSFGSRLKSIAVGALVFNVISSALRKLVDSIGGAVTSADEMKSAIANLKGAASVAFAPALNAISKALAGLTNALATAISYVAQFVSLISGTGISEMKEMAKNMSKTAKSAEKAKKSLAGFDEITALSDSSGSSGAAEVNFDFVGAGNQASESIQKLMDDLKTKILEGDWYGVGETIGTTLSDGIESIDWKNIGATIGEVAGGAVSLALGLALNLDPLAILSSAANLVTGLRDGISQTIQDMDWSEIGRDIVDLLINCCITALILTNPAALMIALIFTPEGTDLLSSASELVGSIIGALLSAIVGAGERIGEIATELWNGIKSWFDESVDWEGSPEDIINGLCEGIVEAVKGIGTWIKENIFDPFIEGFCEAFDINSPAGEMKDPGKNIIFGVFEGILAVLSSIGTWIEENIFGPFIDAFESAFGINGDSSEELETQGGNLITGLFNGIKTAWDSIPEFFTEAFESVKRSLKDIWENGIVPVIRDPVNSIIGFINSMISGICDGINTVIRALNRISFDIPNWDIFGSLAGKKFGFDFSSITAPQIPYLAQGAVLPANKPFLAMVGDQKHGTNVEAPLSTIQEAVALVMQDHTAAILAGFEASVGVQKEILEAVLGIQIGDDVIGNAAARYSRKLATMRGGTL